MLPYRCSNVIKSRHFPNTYGAFNGPNQIIDRDLCNRRLHALAEYVHFFAAFLNYFFI